MASVRTSDSDDVEAMVSSKRKSKSECPGSFKFQLPHDEIEVPREDVNVPGSMQETVYTFEVMPSQVDNSWRPSEVALGGGDILHGKFHRKQYFEDGEGSKTGWVTWQPFDQRENDTAIFGGPGNNIKWSVAEKWHEAAMIPNSTTSRAPAQQTERQGEPTSSWSWTAWLSGSKKSIVTSLLHFKFGELMYWWEKLLEDQKWLGALLLYMTFTDLGQQVVHVGFDKNLVEEGRTFAADNYGIPNDKMRKPYEAMFEDLWMSVESSRKLRTRRPSVLDIASSGVTCLHFEPPAGKDFMVEESCRMGPTDSKATAPRCKRHTRLPLNTKLFLYSGQTTLWPENRLGTLTGVAFLEIKRKRYGRQRSDMFILSVFVAIGTFASMPPSMFLTKVFEHKPRFYVGTLYHTEPPQHSASDVEDCRKNPLAEQSWIKKYVMKLSTVVLSDVLERPPARPSINRTRQCNACYDRRAEEYPFSNMDMTLIHNFANKRARGEDPLKTENGRHDLATVMRTLQTSFSCSGSYLWTPGVEQQVTLGDCLAWVHFMMEAPQAPRTLMVDGEQVTIRRGTGYDALTRTWTSGAPCTTSQRRRRSWIVEALYPQR
eukprot:TRINITY_DN15261_c0_g6_i1.p1 TRINITY_DN15261_c0_g6~~TRINITY_DN15261_c0_g6_i1.p1  ORF type:complete len:645 (-),score=25.11 TRINITY_DN15261_c0_g6_i1:131-1930(-)